MLKSTFFEKKVVNVRKFCEHHVTFKGLWKKKKSLNFGSYMCVSCYMCEAQMWGPGRVRISHMYIAVAIGGNTVL